MRNRLLTTIVISVIILLGALYTINYNKKHDFLYGDAMGYYSYLPATFIYHNLQDMETLPPDKNLGHNVYTYLREAKEVSIKQGDEHLVVQYTYGVALMEAPFFFIAHIYAKVTGQPADGYSNVYHVMLIFAHMLYVLLGCILIYKILRRYYTHTASILTIALIMLGTNLFWFTFRQQGMSHTPLFFLYALLMYITMLLHTHPKRYHFLLLGLIIGIITVMRPTDIICLIIPLLYGVYNKETLRNKITLIKENSASIALAAVIFVIPIIPQMLFWHLTTGKYIYYSYGTQSFNWSHPEIIKGLFSFGNGFFPYAPVMIFAVAGLFIMRNTRNWTGVFLLLLPAYIYIIYSWYCYNYINGLGSRPMIHLYPLLAIPLGAFVQYILRRGIAVKILFAGISVFFILIMLNFSRLQAQNKYMSDEANFQFYTGMMLSSKMTYNNLVEYNIGEFQPDENDLVKIGTLAEQDFNDSTRINYVPDTTTGEGYFFHMFYGEEYFPDGIGIDVPYKKEDFKDAIWIKCSGRFMYPSYASNSKRIFVFGILDENNSYIKWKGCLIDNKIGIADGSSPYANDIHLEHYDYKTWGYVYFFTKIPNGLKEGDKIVLNMWNVAIEEMYMDDFKLELYKER